MALRSIRHIFSDAPRQGNSYRRVRGPIHVRNNDARSTTRIRKGKSIVKFHDVVRWNPEECRQETDSGVYQLILRLARPAVITVGALGLHTFPRGTYLYTGRASRGLSKRIERHLRKEKKLRWHIDYLLEQAQIGGIHLYPDKATEECSINNETARVLGGAFLVKRFGSSDCRCTSHLMLIPEVRTVELKAIMERNRLKKLRRCRSDDLHET
jgi:Uri superfamily endonuclease